jgi:hypothetical protein
VAEHGDYQLLAVISKEKLASVESSECLVIGEITSSDTFEVVFGEKKRNIDPSWGQLVALTKKSEYTARCADLLKEFHELELP